MRHLLFNLQGVPDDEADDVRTLLIEHEIAFYETQAGRWRIGLAGIWLPNDLQKSEALSILEGYQHNRFESLEEDRRLLRELGIFQGMLQQFYVQPFRFVGSIVAISVVLMISILPFVN